MKEQLVQYRAAIADILEEIEYADSEKEALEITINKLKELEHSIWLKEIVL